MLGAVIHKNDRIYNPLSCFFMSIYFVGAALPARLERESVDGRQPRLMKVARLEGHSHKTYHSSTRN